MNTSEHSLKNWWILQISLVIAYFLPLFLPCWWSVFLFLVLFFVFFIIILCIFFFVLFFIFQIVTEVPESKDFLSFVFWCDYNFSLFTLPRICDFGIFKPLIFNRFLYLGNMLDFLVCYDMVLGTNLKCPSFANAFFQLNSKGPLSNVAPPLKELAWNSIT